MHVCASGREKTPAWVQHNKRARVTQAEREAVLGCDSESTSYSSKHWKQSEGFKERNDMNLFCLKKGNPNYRPQIMTDSPFLTVTLKSPPNPGSYITKNN